VLIDPIAVPQEVDRVETIVLSNRLHRRDSFAASERFDAPIRVPRPGMHAYEEGDPVEPYDFGESLAGGAVRAYEVDAICPDEAALHVPSLGALAVADGVHHYQPELAFFSDGLMDDPEQTKAGLRTAYRRLCDELDFEHLLTAHGDPIAGDGRERLRDFAAAES
jgi:glyoxylase-like metal-dependent hydrolase (beta-lactamase superfamily II)